MRFILITSFILVSAFHHMAHSQEEYPKTAISNNVLDLDIYLPDAEKGYYRGTRFEWSGLVQEVRFKGHRYFGDWKYTGPHDPTNHDDVNGIPGEFSMGLFGVNGPHGYTEAKPGEPFLKMGVGLLEKIEDKPYSPFDKYKIVNAFDWDIEQGTDWIEMTQEIDPFQDLAYQFTKKISLLPNEPVMVVEHTIKNTGSKELETTYYCHNFVKIDQEPVNHNYEVRFPFSVTPSRTFGDFAHINNNAIKFDEELVDKALFSELNGFGKSPRFNGFAVEHIVNQASLFMESTAAPHIYNFYAARYAVCPEPFVLIQLQPGESLSWNNRYIFEAEVQLDNQPLEWPLEVRIPGGIDLPKMPLKDFLAQIYFKTGVKFSIDEGIEAFVQAELPGNPTVQSVLEAAFKNKDLLFKKYYSGVIRIYQIEKEADKPDEK